MNKICNKLISTINNQNFLKCSTKINRQFCFKSDICLEKLYPASKLKLYTPPPPLQTDGKFTGYIPMDEIKITYSRSSGPGGQNVNCVNTKVDLRFNVSAASFISESVKNNLLEKYKNQINKEGCFVVRSDTTRSQQMNLADALEKLRCIIREVEQPKSTEPTPETMEKIRKMHEKSSRIRLQIKRERSNIKLDRQGI